MRHPDVVLITQEIEVGLNFFITDDLKEVLAEAFFGAATDDEFFIAPFFLVTLQYSKRGILGAVIIHIKSPVFIVLILDGVKLLC
jgi:hypothetical protein